MFKIQIPVFCQPCITRLQAACMHLHTGFQGNWHFSGGDAWDDITEVCDDCGANLDELARSSRSIPEETINPNYQLTQEKI